MTRKTAGLIALLAWLSACRRPGRQNRPPPLESDGRRQPRHLVLRVRRELRPRAVEQRQRPVAEDQRERLRRLDRLHAARLARDGRHVRRARDRRPGRPGASSRTSRRRTPAGRSNWKSGPRRGAFSKAPRRTTRPPRRRRSAGGYNVVTWKTTQKAPSGTSYKVVGYINDQNLVEKVETWLENPIFGDMLVEALYTEYRGRQRPEISRHDRAEARRLGRRSKRRSSASNANPGNIAQLVTPPRGRSARRPAAGGARAAAAGPTSEKLADGVYRINGAYNAHGDRVQGSHRALRGRTAERSAVAWRSSRRRRR